MSGKGNLFICCTPLQGLIAEKIIKKECLDKKSCHIFFYTSFDSEVYRSYYERVRGLCDSGLYYVWRPNFPAYVLDAKKYFRSIEYDSCWFASIDSIFAQFSLQRGDKKIYTFDDGAANIVPGSHYYRKKDPFTIKKFVFWMLGNQYSSDRVKKEIVCHYTIFPGLDNITPNVREISVIGSNVSSVDGEICTVILGTVLRELCSDEDTRVSLNKAITRYVLSIDHKVFYIPHPREGEVLVHNVEVVRSDKIAEDVISDILSKYSKVDLIGFGSTAQLNLASVKAVTNIFFSWKFEPETLQQVRAVESMLSSKPATVINLNDI